MAKFRLLKVECPKCNTADNVRSIYDYERNLEIFQCKHCRESFAVRQEDVWNNGHDWVTQECRHVKPRTIEDVLVDMLETAVGYSDAHTEVSLVAVEKCADEIRELMEVDR